MSDREYTSADVAAVGACQRLKPTEADFMKRPGYKRTYRPDGSYTWRCRFKPNENGKMTREAREIGELFAPFAKADTERFSAIQRRSERATLTDADGGARYVDAALADKTARSNGWSHRWRAGGMSVERGVGASDMLWRRNGATWDPLGVRCLGTPLKGSRRVARKGVHHDPDGVPWRWIDGAWRILEEV